ncbi:MAG: hypothetical protein QGH51_01575 [Planctomycetota bacterium]|jgi:hypothetical protein|nr:hypothetical protein [Planctomycetota bacterium]
MKLFPLISVALLLAPLQASQITNLYRTDGSDPGSEYGNALCSIGDINQDAVDDLAICAWKTDSNGLSDNGAVHVLSGIDGTELYRRDGSVSGICFGKSVASLGDIDGDGIPDFIVGANDEGQQSSLVGEAFIYSGASGVLLFSVSSQQPGDLFGYAVCGTGDLNDDGIPDFAVGAPNANGLVANSGAVYLFSGLDGTLINQIGGGLTDSRFGATIVSDFMNFDRFQDLIIGSPGLTSGFPGVVSVFSGKASSLLNNYIGISAGDSFGKSIATIDYDLDGFNDILVGAPTNTATLGYLKGYFRVISGFSNAILFEKYGPFHTNLGSAVANLGDVNFDGYPDIAVSTSNANVTSTSQGRITVYSGIDSTKLGTFSDQNGNPSRFGETLAIVPNLDRDSSPDLLVGAPAETGQGKPGRIYTYSIILGDQPTFVFTNFYSGQRTHLGIYFCMPNNAAVIAWSLTGGGPIQTPFGPGYVSPPYKTIFFNTDANGSAGMSKLLPPNSSGMSVWFHGVDLGRGYLFHPKNLIIG